jgi:ribosomal protein S15P/S13E
MILILRQKTQDRLIQADDYGYKIELRFVIFNQTKECLGPEDSLCSGAPPRLASPAKQLNITRLIRTVRNLNDHFKRNTKHLLDNKSKRQL